nr:AAA family ATPase [Fervidobacterium changbaicum]
MCGPRGSGKTTFLLSKAGSEEMFYVSADDLLINAEPFLELAQLVLLSYNGLIVDEVHFLKDGGLQIKSLYDSFPNKKIWINGSGSIALHKSRA